MNRYVKKPIAIEAVKWEGFNNDEIKDFAGDNVKIEVIREGDADRGIPPCIDCSIKTLEGVMTANVGDYIIKGVTKSPNSSSISSYILWISLLRITVLSLTYIFSTSSSQKKILSL